MSKEVNFDGIVGPTHNYSGLSYGNIASIHNKLSPSNPKAAALQGLEKMRLLRGLGLTQGILPPQERPHMPTLRALGYRGTDAEVLSKVAREQPELLLACSSSAHMWAANSATVCPSTDSLDNKVHITPANLSSKFHRSIEAPMTARILKTIFSNPVYFVHHDPLPAGSYFSDEGAANHTRFCADDGSQGVHLFVFGRFSFRGNVVGPRQFPARQAWEASDALARLHQINRKRLIFAQQNPQAIDRGVFHNDVVSVGNRNIFFYHESAFLGTEAIIEEIQSKVQETCDIDMQFVKLEESKVPLGDAVSSYLFNSQLIYGEEGCTLIAPAECENTPSIRRAIEEMLEDPSNPIGRVHYINLRESMRNGGGPACLRLRVVLNKNEIEASHPGFFLDEHLYESLKKWIETHYRDRLLPQDLADPKLLQETRAALDELTKILKIGPMYDFQR